MLPVPVRQALVTTGPRAAGFGQLLAVTVSATASFVELDKLFQPLGTAPTNANYEIAGVTGQEISIFALTASLGVVFGQTAAAVSGANAPAIATVGTLSGGLYTPSGTPPAWPIAAGTWQRFLAQSGIDLFLGFVASGAGTMYLYQSSPFKP